MSPSSASFVDVQPILGQNQWMRTNDRGVTPQYTLMMMTLSVIRLSAIYGLVYGPTDVQIVSDSHLDRVIGISILSSACLPHPGAPPCLRATLRGACHPGSQAATSAHREVRYLYHSCATASHPSTIQTPIPLQRFIPEFRILLVYKPVKIRVR